MSGQIQIVSNSDHTHRSLLLRRLKRMTAGSSLRLAQMHHSLVAFVCRVSCSACGIFCHWLELLGASCPGSSHAANVRIRSGTLTPALHATAVLSAHADGCEAVLVQCRYCRSCLWDGRKQRQIVPGFGLCFKSKHHVPLAQAISPSVARHSPTLASQL